MKTEYTPYNFCAKEKKNHQLSSSPVGQNLPSSPQDPLKWLSAVAPSRCLVASARFPGQVLVCPPGQALGLLLLRSLTPILQNLLDDLVVVPHLIRIARDRLGELYAL